MIGMGRKKRKGMFEQYPGTPPIVAQDEPMEQMPMGRGLFGRSTPKKPGFFDQGGAGRAIAGTIGDVLLQRNDMAPTYAIGQEQRAYQAAQQQQAEAKRLAEREDWLYKQNWERENPKPVNNDTVRDFEWYQGLTPDERKTYHEMKPVHRQGPDGRFYRVEVGDNSPPTRPVGKLTPITTSNTPAPQLNAQGNPTSLTPAQYQAVVNEMGQAETDNWMQRNNIRMGR